MTRATEATRSRAVRRVLVIEMLLNLVVAGAKGAYGIMSGSLAIAADAVHSLVDASANVVGLIIIGRAAEPPDDEHPYGHHKLEIVGAAAIGVVISIAAFRFAWSAVEALWQGRAAPSTSAVGFVVILGTMVVNVFVALYERRRARELKSAYLAADADHTATDVVVTTAVLASYIAAHYGHGWADPVGALLVLGIIVWVAARIIVSNLSILVDAAAIDPDRVRSVARENPGVLDCHRVRSRGTEHAVHLDMHLLMNSDMPLREAHEIAHEVEDALRSQFPELVDVTIHTEPEEAGAEEL